MCVTVSLINKTREGHNDRQTGVLTLQTKRKEKKIKAYVTGAHDSFHATWSFYLFPSHLIKFCLSLLKSWPPQLNREMLQKKMFPLLAHSFAVIMQSQVPVERE